MPFIIYLPASSLQGIFLTFEEITVICLLEDAHFLGLIFETIEEI